MNLDRLRRLLGLLVALSLLTACGAPAAPTATQAPPTAAPPTAVPPTEVSPTQVAPTAVPPAPTEIPPTEMPPTAVPPTAVPPTEAPPTERPTPLPEPGSLILATTTSTADTGLLAAILPYFEARENVKIKVIAVGTGQALAIGARGDADVLLVHARAQEDAFVAAGNGIDRRDVMFNDFVIVGPANDPAGIAGMTLARDAFARIAAAGAPFASRGDGSGTNTKESSLWTAAGLKPKSGSNGYVALGQGMGETLLYSNETGAYTLTDRGTWLARRANLPNLVLLVGGDSIKTNPDVGLYNPYGVIAVNPARFPKVNYEKARLFVEWITSLAIQRRIYEFGRDLYGQSLFYPVAQTP